MKLQRQLLGTCYRSRVVLFIGILALKTGLLLKDTSAISIDQYSERFYVHGNSSSIPVRCQTWPGKNSLFLLAQIAPEFFEERTNGERCRTDLRADLLQLRALSQGQTLNSLSN